MSNPWRDPIVFDWRDWLLWAAVALALVLCVGGLAFDLWDCIQRGEMPR